MDFKGQGGEEWKVRVESGCVMTEESITQPREGKERILRLSSADFVRILEALKPGQLDREWLSMPHREHQRRVS